MFVDTIMNVKTALHLYATISLVSITWAQTPLSLEDARRVVARFVQHYNEVRLHSALGYISPRDFLDGRAAEIHARREELLATAREARARQRQATRDVVIAQHQASAVQLQLA